MVIIVQLYNYIAHMWNALYILFVIKNSYDIIVFG